MGNLLGHKKAAESPITDNDRALLTIKVTKNRLTKHRAGIVRTIERESAAAREHAAEGNRLRARDALRRKKYWMTATEKTDEMLMCIDEVLTAIETAQLNKVVYEGIAAGTAVLKQMQQELSLEKAERLMDERADALAVQDEVDAALGTEIDADLENQLQRLEAQTAPANRAPDLALPSAPTTAVADASLRENAQRRVHEADPVQEATAVPG
jgi:charged multivesicular body protein 6